ncbi:MAG: thiamine diphosphokinase [Rhodobacteraceae bacterium]|jgi:thiamine pyrophosphokinase|nr:thiamine diphosphokinase [Paracoccaceae bacterium]
MSVVYAKSEGITLVGGGVLEAKTLDRALLAAPWLVAADGGADTALALGRCPDLTVGDLDSLSDTLRAVLGPARLHRVETQDDTDFDKALAAIAAPFVLAVGFSGGRLDHTLAAMNTLARNPGRCVILDTGRDLCCLLPPALALSLSAGTRVSLFPLGPVACTSAGLEWPVDGLAFTPLGRIGTSNRATGGEVRLTCDAPAMLLMVPPDALETLLSALSAAPPWPARVPAQ